MKRRLIGLITALAIGVSIVTPAFAVATENSVERQAVSQNTLNIEIDNLYQETMKEVYRQLEKQDALIFLDTYEKIIRGHAELSIYSKYGILPASSNANTYHMATEGGYAQYSVPVPGYEATEMTIIYLCEPRTSVYLFGDDDNVGFTPKEIISLALGFVLWDKLFPTVPHISAIMAGLLAVPVVLDWIQEESIKSADMTAMIMNTNNPELDTSAEVIVGWTEYPLIPEPNNAIDYYWIAFDEYVRGEELKELEGL